MGALILESLGDAWANFLRSFTEFLPRILAMLSILFAGWVVAILLRLLARQVFRWLKFARLSEGSSGAEMLRQTGLPPADSLVASLVFWVVWIGFLLSGLNALGLPGIDALATDFLRFIPQLLVAIAIMAVGIVVANFAWRATLLTSVNANIRAPRLVSSLVRAMVMILTVAMALDQLAVARSIVLTAFAIAFGALMLGVGIALGLGASTAVRNILDEQLRPADLQKSDKMSHL